MDAVASGADSLADTLGLGVVSAGVDSVADGEADVSGADSLTDVLGVGVVSSVAYAAGAASSATGAMTAVAAAAAMARRSFMKTSESPGVPQDAVRTLGEASACGAREWPLIQQV
ncbi:hypothetical protein GCM10017668_43320 [Streptomyces tuirus]|uniref:Uncharacterized protein n=1 Tax=Streptomyces tuirus TaxID=68278 RepID=A0A7G1NI11_9ACTN|nr:hypothetical protein GCM10017668_43320 [Streptomyces tuirus]